jgi:hypothetical protein
MIRQLLSWLERRLGMTDALFQRGREPWLPTTNASNLRVLHVYEVPTVGTFDVGGSKFVFHCLSGHLDRVALWAYAPLSQIEVQQTQHKFADLKAFEKWLALAFTYRSVRFATTIDDEIEHWSDSYEVEDDPLPAASDFIECLLEAVLEETKRLERARSRKKKPLPQVHKHERPKSINQVVIDAELREFEALTLA